VLASAVMPRFLVAVFAALAGRSLADVKAAQPAKGYVGRYGNSDRLIESVYQSLTKVK
jgi:hypothetical protein